jgi:hypothetical protein
MALAKGEEPGMPGGADCERHWDEAADPSGTSTEDNGGAS